jgi:hypothetical protein
MIVKAEDEQGYKTLLLSDRSLLQQFTKLLPIIMTLQVLYLSALHIL